MTISVAVNGALGNMGSLAAVSLGDDPRFSVVGKLGRGDQLAAFIREKKPDVVVDLTRSDVVYANVRTIVECGARPVVGTSGLTMAQIETLTACCQQQGLGGLIVPNFSIAVVLMIQFAKQAARLMDTVEIVEMHHSKKFDAPSGTAIKTAQEIASMRRVEAQPSVEGHARGELVAGIPVHALRLPGVLAKQSVIFGALGETLTLTQESIDRRSFMAGLLLACEKVMALKTMKYGLEHVIEGF